MKIAQKYSHLNGEEYLIVHHKNLYDEIIEIIEGIDANKFKNKISKEKTMPGKKLFSPVFINKEFEEKFRARNWKESRYRYYITLDRKLMEESISMTPKEQKEFLMNHGEENPIFSYILSTGTNYHFQIDYYPANNIKYYFLNVYNFNFCRIFNDLSDSLYIILIIFLLKF